MPICGRLRHHLAAEFAKYRLVTHRKEFGAQRVAAAAHVPGRDVAKVVVLRDGGGEYLMAVIPSQSHLDLSAVAWATGRKGLRLATEAEFAPLFPDCEVGAMPPFGELYGMPTYLDGCFRDDPEIFFPAGTHRELVKMAAADYEAVARPVVGRWCLHRRLKAA
jgi:Ala-tRNA(Pro) deacylase